MWSMAVPRTSSSKAACQSTGGSSRSMPPKPSTVPMRVSWEMAGWRTPLRSSSLVWATLGNCSGQVSRPMSSTGVPKSSTRLASQASMAGTRLAVRGDT